MWHDFITNLSAIILALVALLGVVGGGLRFVWKKIEGRFEGIEKKLADCQERDAKKDTQLQAVVFCVRLTIDEIERLDPKNHVLSQVREMLTQFFPVHLDTPADMAALLKRVI